MISSNVNGGISPHTSNAISSSSNNPLPKKIYKVKNSDEKRQEFKRLYPGFPSRLKEAFRTGDQNEIARKLGCTPTSVNYYLNQVRMPKQDVLKKISTLTGCSIHWLLFAEGSKWVVQETSSSSSASSEINFSSKIESSSSDPAVYPQPNQ